VNLIKQLHDELADHLRVVSNQIDSAIGDDSLDQKTRSELRSIVENFDELLEQLRADLLPSTGKSPQVFSIAIRKLIADILDKAKVIQGNALSSELANQVTELLSFPRELLTSPKIKFEPESSLSAREREVLKLLPQGLTSKEMALSLFLTEATIKTHLASIYRKLQVGNRVQAIAVALESGLIKSK